MGFRLALCTLILDDLELAYFKVIKIARQILREWWQIQWLCQRKSIRGPPVRYRLASWTLTLDDLKPSYIYIWDFRSKYLEYGDRYNVGLKGDQIENNQWTSDWHYELWPWPVLIWIMGLETACIGQIHVSERISCYGIYRIYTDGFTLRDVWQCLLILRQNCL